ncbi:Uncharacterised protein [Serratia quinivorans]|jgi:peptidoglycan/LPS O-acetylase OafA/YrhL|uniref:Phage holin family protein n=1 Tax=Serratia quinivorans TaxID=137545 RepID=A0ABV3UKC2_9GAMM|nr:phage holin family protein [Serratia quinivorans]CAI1565944.1 Uncharacterised protein [Serratia quinivorans]CAI1697178.1 Uncharacterised protein [Serratia quinivorans]CAI1723417.1 Uncharacterised protein [Serratia quinivorans]
MLLTDKTVFDLSAMAFISLWGGMISFFLEEENKNESSKRKSILSMLMKIMTSSFVGILAGLFAIDSGYTTSLTLCLAGIAGSMGSVLLNKVQQRLIDLIERKLP